MVTQAAAHHGDSLTHQGGLDGGQRVGLPGEQAQNHVLADDAAAHIEAAHPNVIQVIIAGHSGAGIRLRDVHGAGKEGTVQSVTGERDAALTLRRPQKTESRPGAIHQGDSAGSAVKHALLDTHEHEVTAGEPVQEVLSHLHAGGGLHTARISGVGLLAVAEGCATQLIHGLGNIEDRGDHAIQVGVAGTHVIEHAAYLVLQQAQVIFTQVAGQPNRNPGLNGDRGTFRRPLRKLQGGHADCGCVAAGQVGPGTGTAQADELAIRVTLS